VVDAGPAVRGRRVVRIGAGPLVGLAALVLSVAACGGGGPDTAVVDLQTTSASSTAAASAASVAPTSDSGAARPAASARLAASVRQTAGVESARMVVTSEVVGGEGPPFGVATVVKGAVDFVTGESVLTTDLGSTFGVSTASPDRDGVGEMDLSVEVRTVEGGDSYMRAPFLAGIVLPGGAGDGWLHLDTARMVAELGPELGVDLGSLAGSPDLSPLGYLAIVEAADGGDIEDRGPGEIDGVEVHELATSATLAELIAAGDDDIGRAVERLWDGVGAIDGLDGLGLDISVFVDEDELVRRIAITMDGAALADASGRALSPSADVAMDLTVDLGDFGVDVDVVPPPPDQVVDITDRLIQMVEAGQVRTAD
jgi:hypothetical protein